MSLRTSYTLLASEISPHLVTSIHPGELLIVFGVDLALDGTLGTLRIALPSSMFEPVRGPLLAALAREHPIRDDGLLRLLEEALDGQFVAQAQRADGAAVTVQGVWFARAMGPQVRLYHAVVYTAKPRPDVADAFFAGLTLH